ncbi:MAG: class A beta-lactamase [Acidobacteriota bacterium]
MTKMKSPPLVSIVVCFTLGLAVFAQESQDKTLRLPLGDPDLKNKTVSIAAGSLYSSRTGKPIPFEKMIKELAGSRFIYVGESHDSLPIHDFQLRLIQALFETERDIAIGLEMLPTETQPILDKWSQGLLTKDELIREARWYVHWSMNLAFYEKIFAFAKDNKIPVIALNAPREVITRIRMKGWESLSEAEKALVPRPDLSLEEHRTLIRTIFETSELPHAMKGEGLENVFEGLYRAQVAWDEVMAANAIKGAGQKFKMVVLAGSGHVLYGLGVNRRVYDQNRLLFKTIVPVSLGPNEKSIPVAASLADYVWGFPEEERLAYPTVGMSFKKIEGLANLVIDRKPIDGVAVGADFEKGDIVLSVDGRSFDDINELRIYLADFGWDEVAHFRLLRGGEAKEVVLKFQLKPQASDTKKDEKSTVEAIKKPTATISEPKIERLRERIKSVLSGVEGEIGIAVKHLESGQSLEVNAGDSFPMASVFKLPILVEVMAQITEGRLSLDDEVAVRKADQHFGSGLISSLTAPGLKLSVRNLVQLMMMISDNSATDILLEKIGVENVNKRLRESGIEGISVNRSCQELIMDYTGLDYQKYKGWTLDQLATEYEKTRDRNPDAFRENIRKFSRDLRDQSTPAAMNSLLEKIFKTQLLDQASCDFMISVMLRCQTGEARLRGDLPEGTAVAHKTGTIAGTVNDSGIIYLPDGLGHIAIAVFTKNFMGKTGEAEKLIAAVARLVYDYFYFTN